MERTFLNRRWALAALTLAGALLASPWLPVTKAGNGESVRQVTVVEMFTSQGCKTCISADETLSKLGARDDVLALSLHVDYWDYIGWEDPFASRLHTERQRAYQRRMNRRYVYTPQLVVDGQVEGLALDREEAAKLLEQPRPQPKIVEPELVMHGDGTATLVVPEVQDFGGEATVWLAFFDYDRETLVKAGDNKGRTVRNVNVVRELQALGEWTGQRMEIPLDVETAMMKKLEGCAVLVQRDGHGPIVGALMRPLPSS